MPICSMPWGDSVGRPPAYNKEQLLEKVTDCLWTQGYAATPISLLVERSGVKAASLYAAFGSKKGIMLASLDAYARRARDEWRRVLAQHAPGRQQMDAFLHALLDASLEDPASRGCFLVNAILEAHPGEPEFAEVLSRYMEELRNILMEELQKAPDLRPGQSAEAAALFAIPP